MTLQSKQPESQSGSFKTWKESAVATGGMVVTAHPLASAAAIRVLAEGGNAIDAAVAAGVAITVVEPFMSTIFGNSYLLIRTADEQLCALDSYGCAPQAANPNMWPRNPTTDGEVDSWREGHRSVLVGGSLRGLEVAHRRFGRLPWNLLMQPAIRLAEGGFHVSPYFVDAVTLHAPRLSRYVESAAQFLPGGSVPSVGQRIFRNNYGQTLRTIAQQGADAIYGGAIGQLIVEDMNRNGGLLTLSDLASYAVLERLPLHGTYRDHDLTVLPPSCSGGAHVIQMLNILELFPMQSLGFGTPEAVHLLLEASRIAFADRSRYMGDPAVQEIPLQWLTSKAYAQERCQGIDPERARSHEPGAAPGWPAATRHQGLSGAESQDTTHLTIVDGEGGIVTMTQTANSLWGSGVTVPGTGMVLNNGMVTLDRRPGLANSVGPGKRGLSTTCPTIISRAGKPLYALGTPGGNRIIPSIAQAVSNLVDHGMTLQEAVEAPRCYAGTEPEVQLERDFSEGTFWGVTAKGHQVYASTRVAGGMQAVQFGPDGVLTGASCWRSDGAPIGFASPTKRAT